MTRLLILFILSCVCALAAEERTSISQYGVTWTFDKAYTCGQFITGDWWVVGPVTVSEVSPKPGPVDKDTFKAKGNQFGDKVLKADLRMRNGSMIHQTFVRGEQAYDSRARGFVAERSESFPTNITANNSLVSTISHDMPAGQNLAHEIMWANEKKTKCVLQAAAILTVLQKAPAADAFRPCFVGSDKKLYYEKNIQWDALLNLEAAKGKPSWAQLERWFERPWMDNLGSWTIQTIGPSENNPVYGREFSRMTGLAALAINCKGTQQEKRKTVIGMIQNAIDLHGFIQNGLSYRADGGHYSGRKIQVMLGGILLGEKDFYTFAPNLSFQEDQDTYYGKTWYGANVAFQMTTHHGPQRSYEHIHPDQWNKFDKRSESYRVCCNTKAWIPSALCMRLMGHIKTWNHDAFFDYCDQWMEEKDRFAKNRGKIKRPKQEGSAYDSFATNMWRKYRATAPDQEMGTDNKKWQWTMDAAGVKASAPGKWIDNPKPK